MFLMSEKYFEIDVGDPLKSERSFLSRFIGCGCHRECQMGKSTEVTYHRLLPGHQLQFDEAMTKRVVTGFWLLMQSVGLSQEEELNLNLNVCCACGGFSRGSTLKAETGRQKARAGRFGVISIHKCTDSSTDTWKEVSRHLLLQACALHKLRVHFGDVSSAFLQTSASGEHQELTIKAPPEVRYLFSDSEGETCSICCV